MFQMKAHSKGKNYFQRSVAQCVSRNLSLNKDKPRKFSKDLGKTQQVGRYKLLLDEELGSGYSSKVFKGVEEGKQLKRYAIKVIELKNFSSSCFQLFDREIEIHRQLKHDNIVRCYDVIRTKTHIYMVMQYCPHGDLASYIHQKKKLAEPAIADIMTQILNGYKYLAKQGILHRDLKPANVLRNGKVWKISDFGFSIRSGSFVDDINVGTPLYMPIESLSRSYYSTKTDIFALGVILFELVHARTPWECDSQTELMKRLSNGQNIKIEKRIVNTKIKEFIVKSCALNEAKRLSKQQMENFSFQFNYPGNFSNIVDDLFTPSYSYRVEQKPKKEDFISSNNGVLLGYLNHCKFVYHMIQHIDCYMLDGPGKSTFLMVLLKYLLKVAKMLEDGRFTSQRLIQFDQYKTKDNYVLLHNQIQESSAKYEKTYLDYIKHADVKIIRQVNTKFRQFTLGSQPLTSEFYTKFREYLIDALRTTSEALGCIVNDSRQAQLLGERLEALNTLIILYRYVDCKSKGNSMNFTFDTLTDYGQTKLKKVDYLNLKKQVKAL